MSNPVEQIQEGEDPKPCDVNPSDQGDQSQEWEIMARAWLCSFPEAKAGSMEEVEAWIDSNHASLPGNLKSMPRSDLCQRLISIQNLMRLSTQVTLLHTTYFLLHLLLKYVDSFTSDLSLFILFRIVDFRGRVNVFMM